MSEESTLLLLVAVASAVVSEIGPDFSPGKNGTTKWGLQPPGHALWDTQAVYDESDSSNAT